MSRHVFSLYSSLSDWLSLPLLFPPSHVGISFILFCVRANQVVILTPVLASLLTIVSSEWHENLVLAIAANCGLKQFVKKLM